MNGNDALICPHCGGPAVRNGSVRAVCKICHKSFDKALGENWVAIKNNEVWGSEKFERISIVRL